MVHKIQNYHDCYEYGKRVVDGEIQIGTAARNVAKTGMDIGSAQIYLRCVCAMIKSVRYTGTVKELAASYFLTQIKADYGFDGLRRALQALHLHLEYQNSYQSLSGLQKIYEKFEKVLP